VTELSNDPPIPENDNTIPAQTAPGVMLFSILLLIGVLVLSSAMLFHYGLGAKADGENPSAFSFSALVEKGKALSARARETAEQKRAEKEAAASTETDDAGVKKFFSGRKGDAVRWPKLKLTGFGRSFDGQSDFAIINKSHVYVDSEINGATLIEISARGVVVEFQGERKTLTVEESL
jgi:hypothetical protein